MAGLVRAGIGPGKERKASWLILKLCLGARRLNSHGSELARRDGIQAGIVWCLMAGLVLSGAGVGWNRISLALHHDWPRSLAQGLLCVLRRRAAALVAGG